MSENYKINISTFNDVQPEIDGTIATTASVYINYLRTVLPGTSLSGFDELSLAGNSTANHLRHIMEGLLDYSSL